MSSTLMIVHGIISILLIISVLLQFGKGAEAGLLSGGGGDSVMSGGQKGNILSKITTVLSVLFMANSILLAKIQSQNASDSLLDNEAPIARPLNSDEVNKPKPAAEESKSQQNQDTKK